MNQAIEQFGHAQTCSDSFYSAVFHQGLMFTRVERFEDALRQFSKVQQKLPADKTVYFERGCVYQQMGNHELAIKDYEQALEIDNKYADAHFHIGKSHLAIKSIKQAELDFKKALNVSVTDKAEIYEGLGLCFHMKQEYEEAVLYFVDAIAKDNTNVQFYRSLSRCYYDQDKFEQSIGCLEKAIGLLKEPDAQVFYELGLSLFAEKKYKKCLKMMKEALKNEPYESYEPDIYYHLGLAYCRMEKFEKAIFPFSKCIERIPSDARYTHERAKAYQMIEMHQEAVADFDAVIKRCPKNAHAYFRRAFSLKALKEFAKAAEDFETAKNLEPLNPQLVVNHKKLKGVGCIVLCEPGMEKEK